MDPKAASVLFTSGGRHWDVVLMNEVLDTKKQLKQKQQEIRRFEEEKIHMVIDDFVRLLLIYRASSLDFQCFSVCGNAEDETLPYDCDGANGPNEFNLELVFTLFRDCPLILLGNFLENQNKKLGTG